MATQTLVVDGEHVGRLLGMCKALNSAKGLKLNELQKKFRISRRTVFRDLKTLQDVGVSVDLNNGSYRTNKAGPACKKAIEAYFRREFESVLKSSLR